MIAYLTPLGPDELRDAGIPAPWTFGMADRVRFGDLDALNHVNNVEYLRWYETLRFNYLTHYSIYELAGDDPKIVVKSVGVDYKAEVKRNTSYINVTRTVSMRNTSWKMEYATFVDGKITTTGDCVAVLLNDDNSKRSLSDALRETLISRDGAVQL
ncbi:MAG TPA: acyl-CoA thioesterase [Octadecabacter sp.]|nr:acyl-CoA thioesterase [Octadecabacter sp.]